MHLLSSQHKKCLSPPKSKMKLMLIFRRSTINHLTISVLKRSWKCWSSLKTRTTDVRGWALRCFYKYFSIDENIPSICSFDKWWCVMLSVMLRVFFYTNICFVEIPRVRDWLSHRNVNILWMCADYQKHSRSSILLWSSKCFRRCFPVC